MTEPHFPAEYSSILKRLQNIEPAKYARSRNFTDGAVTYLSPYISRGVISLRQVMEQALRQNKPSDIYKFLQELAWREYWQRVWQAKGDAIFSDVKQPQKEVMHHKMVTALQNQTTGITAIDDHISSLYATGYMHNHVRMYVASIACNIAKAHWLQPSQWLYYHLLDGDLASNSLSWQWVAGAFSTKKYYCNQENINRYTSSSQQQTILDNSYEIITKMEVPEALRPAVLFTATTTLPPVTDPMLNDNPVLVYNSYNLDPAWHTGEAFNRILLLEPAHFEKHPVSEKVLDFILTLSKNIEGIQIFTANFKALQSLAGSRKIIFKGHPTCMHYEGFIENYEMLFPDVEGYYPSFSAYWKKCSKYIFEEK